MLLGLYKVSDAKYDIFRTIRCHQQLNYIRDDVARRLEIDTILGTAHHLHWCSDTTATNIKTGIATFIVVAEADMNCQIALGTERVKENGRTTTGY